MKTRPSRIEFYSIGHNPQHLRYADGQPADGSPAPAAASVPTGSQPAAGPELHEIKVNGQVVKLTIDEIKKKAELSEGAYQKMETAASAVKAKELLRGLHTGTVESSPENLTQLAKYLDLDPSVFLGDPTPPSQPVGTDKPRGGASAPAPARKLGLEDMDQETKAAVEYGRRKIYEETRASVRGDVEKIVDKDPVIAKIISSYPEGSRAEVRETLINMSFDDVQGKILAQLPYGADLIEEAVQKTRAEVQRIGTPVRTPGQPELSGMLGVGRSSGYSLAELHSEEPIKRVSVSDPGYVENTTRRALQRLSNLLRSRPQ